MAQLDLKNCLVYLMDGYTGPAGAANALVNNKLADPVTAPTHSATGGGAGGGSLAAGTYILAYTLVTALGETLRSSQSTNLVVSAGNIPRVTFPALPAGAVSRKLYISTDGGGAGTQTLYASGITALTYDMAIAAPGTGAFPVVSTAGLTYAVGTTTMIVDGITGQVVTGDYFTVAGRYTRYRITGHSETLGNTTSITFTPGLVTATDDDASVDMHANFLQIRIGDGNLTYSEKKPRVYTKDRGTLDTVRNGDEEPLEVKLDATWTFLKASTGDPPTLEDVLKNRGEASTWLTSSADPCEPYCIDIVVEYTPPCDDEEMEIYRFDDFRYEEIGHDFKQGQLACSGKCNIEEATVTRVAIA
jgi:hypothetical protein